MALLPDATNSRAVLIGTSRYTHLSALPAVANNLTALATALRASSSWGLAEEHCTVIANPGDWTEVLHAVRTAAEEASDTLLVYFAGHGLLEETRGDLFLGLPHSEQGRSYTGVPYSALRDVVLTGRSKRHVVILDCCFSGRALGTMSGPAAIADQAEIEGSYLLAASPETSFALAPEGETYTAFTGELLRLLHEGVPDGPDLLDLDTVYNIMRAALRAKGRPLPQKRDRNTAGQLALSRNAARAGTDRDRDHNAVDTVRTTPPAPNTTPVGDRGQSAQMKPVLGATAGLVTLVLIAGGIDRLLNKEDEDDPPIALGYVDQDDGRAVAYLWQEILAKRGYQAKAQAHTSSDLFAEQAQGRVDVQANARLPATHKSYWKKYKSKLEDFGAWYENTALHIAVPSYVKGIESIGDVEENIEKFGYHIFEMDPGEGAVYRDKLHKAYGLDKERSLTKTVVGTEPWSQLDNEYARREPIAVLLRSPHWEYSTYKLTKLKDPKNALGYSREDIHMLGRKGFTKDEPQVAKWMKNFHLDENQLNSLEYEIHTAAEQVHAQDQNYTQEGVRTWIKKNPGILDKLAPAATPKKNGEDA
ncbi:caspase family protein [Streptomyces decoyicus]|uniref:Caspase family protein n=1 Tax=Streptomyces decoyicus TaxID=249567 RepID=A0ABZ1FW19_9ACTN|nr:glycine betaine ABC transporter substrate-binding protein [Streptomyces decoyicus]WSB73643.1 caspase family protein [Streptomyces decoyicus]